MRFDDIIFDHGRWHYELIEAVGCYRQLRAYCSDEAALRSHLADKGRPWRASEEGLRKVDDGEIERWVVPISESIETAISAYRRQLIVVIVSITEAASAEAFQVLFSFRPETIRGLEKESQGQEFRPVTSLDDLMTATNLDTLRISVVERAVAFATQGRNKQTVLRRIERLFGKPIAANVREQYLALVGARNEIIHDNIKPSLTDEEVEGYFDVGISFVEELGRLVSKHGLPIHDPLQVFNG